MVALNGVKMRCMYFLCSLKKIKVNFENCTCTRQLLYKTWLSTSAVIVKWPRFRDNFLSKHTKLYYYILFLWDFIQPNPRSTNFCFLYFVTSTPEFANMHLPFFKTDQSMYVPMLIVDLRICSHPIGAYLGSKYPYT